MTSVNAAMTFTGERFVPWLKGQIAYEHLHRYEAVRSLCVGKRVLDVASGEGYGSAHLAHVATSVVGIDVDAESVEHARAAYFLENLRFETANATMLPLEAGSVDVVVCFETLEHLTEHDALIREFKRVLVPDGFLVISSPNKAIYSDEADYHNPHHVRELYRHEFDELLRAYFGAVAVYGQQLATVSLLHPTASESATDVAWLLRDAAAEVPDPTYFVAVCSNGATLPCLSSSYFDASDLLYRDGEIAHEATRRRVRELENEAQWHATIASSARVGGADHISEPTLAKRRVIIASSFKAGAEFCAAMIGGFLGAETPNLAYDRFAEHNVSSDLLAQLRDRPFAIDLQMKPHHSNLIACRDAAISTSVLWRNLGDAVISFDENTKRYGANNSMFYVDQETFSSTPPQRRFRFIIDSVVPWNIGFYLAWTRQPGMVMHPYERLVDNTFSYLRTMIWMMGIELDDERLEGILAQSRTAPFKDLARYPTLLDESNRRHLERLVLDHPEAEQLEVLLWELPWEPLELKRRSAYDGSIVAGSDGVPFFVSSGARRNVSTAWLASRGPERLRTAMQISDDALATIPAKSELR